MTRETIARTITTAIVGILAVLQMCGVHVFDSLTESSIYTYVLSIVTIVVWTWGFYKNNDFTQEGVEGTIYTRMLKAHKRDGDIIVKDGDENAKEE